METLFGEKKASEYLGMSVFWLQRERWKGTGPLHYKINRSVRYKESDLQDYLGKCRKSTADGGSGK